MKTEEASEWWNLSERHYRQHNVFCFVRPFHMCQWWTCQSWYSVARNLISIRPYMIIILYMDNESQIKWAPFFNSVSLQQVELLQSPSLPSWYISRLAGWRLLWKSIVLFTTDDGLLLLSVTDSAASQHCFQRITWVDLAVLECAYGSLLLLLLCLLIKCRWHFCHIFIIYLNVSIKKKYF